jgi:hypothetical protein
MSRSRPPSSDRRRMAICRARRVLNSVCRADGESLARRFPSFLPAARTAVCRHAGSAPLHSNDNLADSRNGVFVGGTLRRCEFQRSSAQRVWRSALEIPFSISVCSICGHGEWEHVTPSGKRVSVCATQHFTIVLARQIGVLVSWVEESGSISLR